MRAVAIVIPGIMGSALRTKDTGDLVWPGSFASLVFPYRMMDRLMREDLEVSDIIRSYSISTQYAEIMQDLQVCQFHENADPPIFGCLSVRLA
jgi:phospholipase A1